MGRVIRIDDDVFIELQKKAMPLVDTPNDVLRRVLGLDAPISADVQNTSVVRAMKLEQEAGGMKDSIFIVVNAAGKVPDKENAANGYVLTMTRVNRGVDILASSRLRDAKRMLKQGARIVMHQGGAAQLRKRYPNAGHLVAAGRVKEAVRELTEKDKHDYVEVYELARGCFPDRTFVGIIFYEFPKGMAKEPLQKEEAKYRPMPGDNFIEIKPDDKRYPKIDAWWYANS